MTDNKKWNESNLSAEYDGTIIPVEENKSYLQNLNLSIGKFNPEPWKSPLPEDEE